MTRTAVVGGSPPRHATPAPPHLHPKAPPRRTPGGLPMQELLSAYASEDDAGFRKNVKWVRRQFGGTQRGLRAKENWEIFEKD